METINLDKRLLDSCAYYGIAEGQYYTPSCLIRILEDKLDKPFDEIKRGANNNQIVVTEGQISEFLNQRFFEEDPELKKRVESPSPKRSRYTAKLTKEDIELLSQKFIDRVEAQKYRFDPRTLEYFKKYTDIIKKKFIELLYLIEKIGNKDIQSIKKTLADLDIVLDEEGNILGSDIIRLIEPTIYNFHTLKRKVAEANNLSTYLDFKLSRYPDLSYPDPSILNRSLDYSDMGSVELSQGGKERIRKHIVGVALRLNDAA